LLEEFRIFEPFSYIKSGIKCTHALLLRSNLFYDSF